MILLRIVRFSATPADRHSRSMLSAKHFPENSSRKCRHQDAVWAGVLDALHMRLVCTSKLQRQRAESVVPSHMQRTIWRIERSSRFRGTPVASVRDGNGERQRTARDRHDRGVVQATLNASLTLIAALNDAPSASRLSPADGTPRHPGCSHL